MFETSLEHW